ncbi:MAG: 30S ribosome-binding factor RbfA [Actinomycetia bacterium]|nr:30S ribosome-binding factor RbfA [Actinomycetes bacterium]
MDRIKKLEIDLKRELGFVVNSLVKDPRLGFVTITGINLSPDFKYLDVYVSVMGGQEKIDQSMKALDRSKGFIKKKLNERIKLRAVPVLRFQYDESIDKGMRITEILDELKKNNEL